MVTKNPKWQETNQLAIHKRSRGVEHEATEKQLQPAELVPRTSESPEP